MFVQFCQNLGWLNKRSHEPQVGLDCVVSAVPVRTSPAFVQHVLCMIGLAIALCFVRKDCSINSGLGAFLRYRSQGVELLFLNTGQSDRTRPIHNGQSSSIDFVKSNPEAECAVWKILEVPTHERKPQEPTE